MGLPGQRGVTVIVVLDYGMGNLGSISNMLSRLRVEHRVSGDSGDLDRAAGVILPGVGAFDRGMTALGSTGLRPMLDEVVMDRRVPTLGICLGMQLLARGSEEGVEPGLGFIAADVLKLDAAAVPGGRLPHMGWNRVEVRAAGVVPDDDPTQRFYFVHSYAMACDADGDILATTSYGTSFVSAVHRDNISGVQFHPEKSHRFGLEVLRRFCASTGADC
jgi:glutamine amidotransferase